MEAGFLALGSPWTPVATPSVPAVLAAPRLPFWSVAIARAQQGLQHTGRPMEHSPGAVPSFLSQVNLNTIKRCLLINYNPDSQELDFRH